MVRLGEITEAEARNHPDKNIITRAVGATSNVDIDFFDYKVGPGGIILMCSDGLSNMVEDEEIRRILRRTISIEDKARVLVETANENGGKDNIAVILVEPDSDEEA